MMPRSCADPAVPVLLRTDSLTGSNLLEADFFSAYDPSAELIADFIEEADGLVPGLFASRFDMAWLLHLPT